jgi:hypothetical protein
MTEAELLMAAGGVPEVAYGADIDDAEAVTWNFGIARGEPAVESTAAFLYDAFPNVQGRWDGKSVVNAHNAARKVLGGDIKAQRQVRGTCGSRAGSRGLELLQCILMAAGKRAKYKPVSHAWIYYIARKKYGMLRGNWQDPDSDGVAGGSVPPAMAESGALHRDEAADPSDYGSGSDDLACKWGAGMMDRGLQEKLSRLAEDNLGTSLNRVRSAQELADGLAIGGIGICSDMRGYSQQRDEDGACRPQGTWAHYHVRSGIALPRGRKLFAYDQSWGDRTTDRMSPGPHGPPLQGWPGNCFGVDWDVQDELCRKGEVHVVFGFDLWELEEGGIDIPWIFS